MLSSKVRKSSDLGYTMKVGIKLDFGGYIGFDKVRNKKYILEKLEKGSHN